MADAIYMGDWNSWTDVQEAFEMKEPEPANLLCAYYEYEDYSGYGEVTWLNDDGSIGYVHGSHCSCYGLEGQWEVETYPADVARQMCARADNFGKANPAVMRALA